MSLSDQELERYARHIVLREIGGAGQARLKAARVLVVGAGGIGSPAIQHLAAAGVGTLAIVDDDRVDLSNLQRQTLFGTADIGETKVGAAKARAQALNPHGDVQAIEQRIDPANAAALLAGIDAVIDGSDNFATRLAVADAAHAARVPLISAAVAQFEGQLGVFRGWEPGKPCYRCFVGTDPARAEASCAEQGVLGALTGVMGSLAALEAIRTIVPFGADSAGKLLLIDALSLRFRSLALPKELGVPGMRGLTLIVATGDAERFRAALTIASAHAALGGRTRVYCHEGAVALLVDRQCAPLLATAIETGAAIIACQTGLALAGLAETALPRGVETGGLVGLLADLGDDRLDTV